MEEGKEHDGILYRFVEAHIEYRTRIAFGKDTCTEPLFEFKEKQ